MHPIDEIMEERCPNLMRNKIFWSFIKPSIYKIFKYDEAKKIVDDIINNVHSKINLNPTDDNMMETLTVTEDEITSLIEDTADIKLINGSSGKKSKKNKKDTRVLNL